MSMTSNPGRSVRFGVVADCQYAEVDGTRRNYRASLSKLRRAADVFEAEQVDFVVGLGDMVDRAVRDMEPLSRVLSRCSMPVWHVLGNHDLTATGGDVTAATRMLDMPARFYQRLVGPFRFVFLDSNQDSVLVEVPGSPPWRRRQQVLARMAAQGQVNARPWNGAVDQEQLRWLTSQLDEAETVGQCVVIFLHHPLAPAGEHTALNSTEVLSVLDRTDSVLAVLSGHNHRGALALRRGVAHLTLRGMVQTEPTAFAIVELDGDALRVRGFGGEPSRVLRRSFAGSGPARPARRGAGS